MKVRILFLTALFIFQNHISAQNFLLKDTTNSISKFQFGAGGYLGTHMFINDKQLKNLSGYDNGLFIKAIYNFNRKVSTSIDIRYFERTGVINFDGGLVCNEFQIIATGFEIPFTFSYNFHNKGRKEIASFRAGVSYNHIKYQTTYDEIIDMIQGQWYTSNVHHWVVSKSMDNFSLMFGVSKNFRLTCRSNLCLFNEYDFSLNKFYIEDLTTDSRTSRSWFGDYYFNSFCVRLGCCVIL